MLLPVPRSGVIRSQVINEATGTHYENRSRLSMELLFHGVDSLSEHFELDPTQPGGIIRFVGDNVRFAKEVVPSVPDEHFAIFEPIFDFVMCKCASTVIAASAATS